MKRNKLIMAFISIIFLSISIILLNFQFQSVRQDIHELQQELAQ